MNVFWTEAAIDDLKAIQSYIARRSSQYAISTVERILDRADSLSAHPLVGGIVTEFNDESIRELLEAPYRIIYRVSVDRIDIVTVIHAARELPNLSNNG